SFDSGPWPRPRARRSCTRTPTPTRTCSARRSCSCPAWLTLLAASGHLANDLAQSGAHPPAGRGVARQVSDVRQGFLERPAPGVRLVLDTVAFADGAHVRRDLAQSLRRERREQVMLDLPVEPSAEHRDGAADLVVVRRCDLHRVPLAPTVSARAGRVALHVVAHVAAEDRARRVD